MFRDLYTPLRRISTPPPQKILQYNHEHPAQAGEFRHPSKIEILDKPLYMLTEPQKLILSRALG